MASPQRENGHIDIANDIAKALAKTQLSGYENRIMWALLRKTWGWVQKDKKGKIIRDKKGQPLKLKKAVITSKEWMELTELSKYHISDTLRKLKLRQLVTKFGNKNEWGFQKDYSKWLPPINRIVTENGNTYFVTKFGNVFTEIGNDISEIGNENLPKCLKMQKIQKPKETLKETLKETSENAVFLSHLLRDLMLKNNENAKIPKSLQKWQEEFDKLFRIDKKKFEEAKEVLEWSQYSSFWMANIRSAGKFKKQYDTLYLQMKNDWDWQDKKKRKKEQERLKARHEDKIKYDLKVAKEVSHRLKELTPAKRKELEAKAKKGLEKGIRYLRLTEQEKQDSIKGWIFNFIKVGVKAEWSIKGTDSAY